jgi:rubrerythrin
VRTTSRIEEEGEMVEGASLGLRDAAGYVEFRTTGDAAVGEFHCGECGYGVIVSRELPRCPMCGGTVWEQSAWSPFTLRADLPR